MNLIRIVLVWTGKHFVALCLIVAILIFGNYAWKPVSAWFGAQVEQSRSLPERRAAYGAALADFDAYATARRASAAEGLRDLGNLPEQALRGRLAAIPPAIAAQQAARLGDWQLAGAAATGDGARVAAHYHAGIEIALLTREQSAISALLAARANAGQQRATLADRRAQALARLRSSYGQWQAARASVQSINARPLAAERNALCARLPAGLGCRNYRAAVAAQAVADQALADNRAARAEIGAIDRATWALAATDAAAADASAAFDAERAALVGRIDALDRSARANWLLWIERPIRETLPTALLILLGAILSPILFKAFLYFVIAPLASRRAPVRLLPEESGAVTPVGEISSVSRRVALDAEHELIVLPEFLQSSPHGGRKSTQWLLDWRMPFTSLACGMVALTRMRAAAPDHAAISATRDPLAELGMVAIAPGAAMVLQPRALIGLVQPVGTRPHITRHWRLGHLSAWLTFQFRYIVFHGPCTLIVQGTRGICLERAGTGRGINRAATIGFSAGAAYSVRRSETFGAYLLGKQDLFNDSFEGSGVYLYEEMPRARSRTGLFGRGLEGLGDAVLKVFGI